MIFLAFILMASLSLFTACQTGCQPSGSGEEPDEDETFVYARQEDGTYAISRIKSLEPSEITIPLQFKGKDITFFAENLFAGYENLTDIYFSGEISDWCRIKFGNAEANPMHLRKNLYFNGTIPDGNLNIGNVSRINDYAFVHYDRVANLILEEGITEVGRDAFYDCPNLMTVTLPKSLGRLGFRAFYDLKNLISIHFNGTLSDWMTLEMEEASNPIRASVALYLGDELVEGELIVPEDVKEVGDYVFEFYDKITSVTLSHGVKSIGNSSFYRNRLSPCKRDADRPICIRRLRKIENPLRSRGKTEAVVYRRRRKLGFRHHVCRMGI